MWMCFKCKHPRGWGVGWFGMLMICRTMNQIMLDIAHRRIAIARGEVFIMWSERTGKLPMPRLWQGGPFQIGYWNRKAFSRVNG